MNDLIIKARSGDTEAFVHLMDEYRQPMVKTARAFFSEQFDIDDVIQDTIISCWLNLPKLRQPEYFKTWAIRILINNCKTVLKKRRLTLPIEDAENTGDSKFDPDSMSFDDIMKLLSQKYRVVLTLYYSDGFNTSEIAEILRLPVDTVKSRLRRGREQLEEKLKGDENA